MDHSVTQKPMVGTRIDRATRVRPVAKPPTLQLVGQRSGHRQVVGRDLLDHRSHGASQVGVQVGIYVHLPSLPHPSQPAGWATRGGIWLEPYSSKKV